MPSPLSASALALVLATLLPASAVQAQRSASLDGRSGGAATLVDQDDRGTLDARIRVSFETEELPRALETIARAAGLDLAYVSDALPDDVRVSWTGGVETAGVLFRHVLEGSGLQVRGPTSSGHFVILPQPEPSPVEAEDGTVVGTVRERSSGEPVAGVNVYVEGSDRTAISGADGRFAITRIPAGTWTLRVTSIGYTEATRTVEIEEGATVSVDFALETRAVSMDEIVVTGSVTPTPVRELPTPITVIRATDIERQNVESVDELFRLMIPGGVQTVQSPGPGGYAEFSVRGISSLTIFSTIKVFVDGVEVENPAYIKAIDPASVERVEFISGPQASSIYGSGAISGVMQVFTKKGVPGQQRPSVNGLVALGTIDDRYVESRPITQEYRLSVNGGGESYGYNLGGSWEQESAWKPGSQDRGGSLYGGAKLELGDVTANVLLRYRGDFDDPGIDPRAVAVLQEPEDVPATDRFDWHSQTYGLNLSYEATDRWSHEMALGYDGGSEEQYTTEPQRATPADTFNTLSIRERRKLSVRYNTSYRIPLGDNELTLIGGGDYASQSVVSLSSLSLPASSGPVGSYSGLSGSRSVQTLAGAFAQGQLGLADRVFLTLGAHGDMSEGQNGVAWSPRVGASFVQNVGEAELKLRGAYGSALIAPDPSSKTGLATNFFVIRANPDLLPERQVGYDLGAELYWGNRASLSFTYFDQTAEDLVALTFLEFDPSGPTVFQYQNVGQIENKGWEVSATLVPIASLELTGVFGKTDSNVRDLSDAYGGDLEVGDRLRRVPDWTAGATVAWTPMDGMSLTARLTHRASWIESRWESYFRALAEGTFTGNSKDYWVDYEPITKIGLGLQQRLSRSFRGFLRVENLTNTYDFEGHDLITPRGREVQVGVRFNLD